jgi:hypothetical protein
MLFILLLSVAAQSAELVYTFANGSVSGSSPKFYTFDVMLSASQTGTQLGDTQIYINYSTDGFGTDIVQNAKISVSKGAILTGDYQIVNTIDNTSSKFVVTIDYTDAGATPVDVTTSPAQVLQIQIEVADDSKSAGLVFDDVLMTNQQYVSDDATKYAPVTAGNTDDSKFTPISVDLVSFSATAFASGVELTWKTANEINLAGFNIFRSLENEGNYSKINSALIASASQPHGADYRYVDNPADYATYYYKLQSVDLDGSVAFHPSQKVEYSASTVAEEESIPSEFKLEQNYPNPFNPETLIRYQLPSHAYVDIIIYNLFGQRVKHLVSMSQAAGHHSVVWDGLDSDNRQVGSCTYILSMKAGDFTDFKRLTLLR